MIKRRVLALISAITLTFVAACATAVPPEMAPEAFGELLRDSRQAANPILADRQLSKALNGQALGPNQRIEVLYARAKLRWGRAYDKPGAVEDLAAIVEQDPTGPKAEEAAAAIDAIGSEIIGHQARLDGLQTLSDWFDDMVALGAVSEAAARYQNSGLTPTAGQTDLLVSAGYICRSGPGGPETPALHRYGEQPAHADGLVWCQDTPIT